MSFYPNLPGIVTPIFPSRRGDGGEVFERRKPEVGSKKMEDRHRRRNIRFREYITVSKSETLKPETLNLKIITFAESKLKEYNG